MGFRLRLALFFVATLVTVQLLTAGLVYEVTRHALISEGERQLTANARAFEAQMDDISARVAGNVEVLSLDYALRSAIAERDRGTVLSVLRNHGRGGRLAHAADRPRRTRPGRHRRGHAAVDALPVS